MLLRFPPPRGMTARDVDFFRSSACAGRHLIKFILIDVAEVSAFAGTPGASSINLLN
ncbi:MAG: hypothetical protein ACR2FN_11370 [Chitinophagaceae bacterium]